VASTRIRGVFAKDEKRGKGGTFYLWKEGKKRALYVHRRRDGLCLRRGKERKALRLEQRGGAGESLIEACQGKDAPTRRRKGETALVIREGKRNRPSTRGGLGEGESSLGGKTLICLEKGSFFKGESNLGGACEREAGPEAFLQIDMLILEGFLTRVEKQHTFHQKKGGQTFRKKERVAFL